MDMTHDDTPKGHRSSKNVVLFGKHNGTADFGQSHGRARSRFVFSKYVPPKQLCSRQNSASVDGPVGRTAGSNFRFVPI